MKTFEPHPIVQRIARPRIVTVLLILLGFLGLYLSTRITNPYTVLYPSSLIFGAIIFAVLGRNKHTVEITYRRSTKKILLIAYFLIITILMNFYYSASFQRTQEVFLLTFLLYVLIGVYVFSNGNTTVGLSLIILTGLINRATAYYSSTLYVGVDIYGHNTYAQAIARSGSLEALAADKYFYAPVYHVLTGSSSLILDIPVRDTAPVTTMVVVTVVPALVVYCLTKYFWSSQTGLLAALLYVSADHVISLGVHTIPTSLGVVIFGLVFLTLMRHILDNDLRFYILAVVLFGVLTFVHQISLFIAMTAGASLLGFLVVYRLRTQRAIVNIGLLATLILFIDFTTTRYRGITGELSFFDVVLSQFVVSMVNSGTETRPEHSVINDPSITSGGAAALTPIHVAGSAILIALGVIGSLYWMQTKTSSKAYFSGLCISVTVAIFFAFTLGGPIVGVRNLMPTRWFPFTYLLLAILAAPGVVYVVTNLSGAIHRNQSVVSILLLILILSPLVGLMGGNYAAASDSPYFDDAPRAESHRITESEKTTFEHAVQHSGDTDIVADRRASAIFSRYYGIEAIPLLISHDEPNTLRQPSLIVDRAYIHTEHSQYIIRTEDQTTPVYGPFPLDEIQATDKDVVYDNGDHRLHLYENSSENA